MESYVTKGPEFVGQAKQIQLKKREVDFCYKYSKTGMLSIKIFLLKIYLNMVKEIGLTPQF